MERNTAIRSADFQLALNQFMNTVTDILALGMKAKTLMGVFAVVLQGRINSPDEEFRLDSPDANHKIRLQWCPFTGMKKNVAHDIAIVKNIDNLQPLPNAASIKNMSKPELNEYASKAVTSGCLCP